MSWLRIDDRFSRHPKVTQLSYKERWTWMDLLCYCASYQTGGWLPENIKEHVAGATVSYLSKCSALELVDVVAGELRIHDWETYAPKDPTGAERQASWRRRTRNSRATVPVTDDVTESVTKNVTGESSTSRTDAARVPVLSCPDESKGFTEASSEQPSDGTFQIPKLREAS